MKPQHVGTYLLGLCPVSVCLRSGFGGDFAYGTTDEHAQMNIGADEKNWNAVFAVLCHEAFEMAMLSMDLRFTHSYDVGKDNGSYLFVMTHTQFSESNARAAHFLAEAMPDLAKAWRNRR